MSRFPVIKNFSYCLIHTPDLIRYGSKTRREITRDPDTEARIAPYLRSYSQAVCYPPNQVFVGNLTPDELTTLPRPWYTRRASEEQTELLRQGPFGEILNQETFYGLLKAADIMMPPLIMTDESNLENLREKLAAHPLCKDLVPDLQSSSSASLEGTDQSPATTPGGNVWPLQSGKTIWGFFQGDQRSEAKNDENLQANNLLENLCSKASGALALKWLCRREAINPEEIDFIISCGEEACGDRYQRGGGGMAKAMGQMCGCRNASGMDIKNFCAAPASSIITAAALVQAGIHQRVAVVGGGSLAKLGMKFQSFVQQEMPILDDCLGAMAFLVTADDGKSPCIRLSPGGIGTVPVKAGTSDEAVFRYYLLEPLARMGLTCTDIDRYAAELQNPEIMDFAGAGDVAQKNYRKIGAMAVRAGQLDKGDMASWISRIGMVGFAPTQGHIPSAMPYIGHAMTAMARGEIRRAMFLSRASLFLNRCTDLLDGVSFVLERNPRLPPIKKTG
ncbi:MAG: glycine reductase [Desulfobulbaceae bacterium]|uniref:Glycine reductase n=1 Tax=Candidatus Desulfatifera sulfidica TaxID=2841691 RepID=A0A8J6NA08_9BACT|nr:glycine reductase [Candidatus Desulfatifera sulfidica]